MFCYLCPFYYMFEEKMLCSVRSFHAFEEMGGPVEAVVDRRDRGWV